MCLGIPMKIVELLPAEKAVVESGGVSFDISLQLVENAKVGDYVLVHAGFAIEVIDALAAKETLDLLEEMFSGSEKEFTD